jgi:transposase
MVMHCGVDLHGDNGYYGIMDQSGKRVLGRRLPNDLGMVLGLLEPYRESLREGVVVESTFNWYWLADGLGDHGYRVRLANPAAMEQYNGLKNSDDKSDAFFLAELSRLGIVPEGHIYPQEDRPGRDLLRRRRLLVQQRTAHILSFQSLAARELGGGPTANQVHGMHSEDVEGFFDDRRLVLMGRTNVEVIRFLTERINELEGVALKQVALKAEYVKLLTAPGIGQVLALTIMLETGDVRRFKKAGNYTSYCRCVKSKRESNGRLKGENNRKNGNRYLCWAYIEAANFIRRYCPEAKAWYQRKLSRSKRVVATKALAAKIAKACYFMMRDQVDFDVKKMFG